jgi:hypothetical protein
MVEQRGGRVCAMDDRFVLPIDPTSRVARMQLNAYSVVR